MNLTLQARARALMQNNAAIVRSLNQAVYLLITLVLVLASAIYEGYNRQLLVLSFVAGLKWIAVSINSVTQIFIDRE